MFKLAAALALGHNLSAIHPLELQKSAHKILHIQPSCQSGVWIMERTTRKTSSTHNFHP